MTPLSMAYCKQNCSSFAIYNLVDRFLNWICKVRLYLSPFLIFFWTMPPLYRCSFCLYNTEILNTQKLCLYLLRLRANMIWTSFQRWCRIICCLTCAIIFLIMIYLFFMLTKSSMVYSRFFLNTSHLLMFRRRCFILTSWNFKCWSFIFCMFSLCCLFITLCLNRHFSSVYSLLFPASLMFVKMWSILCISDPK